MSAFVVDNETITNIVTTFADDYRSEYTMPAAQQELGDALYIANQNAVNGRYNEHDEPPTWRYGISLASPVSRFKSFRCFLYQCAEDGLTPQDETLIAKVEARAAELAAEIISNLPEYDAAPWG